MHTAIQLALLCAAVLTLVSCTTPEEAEEEEFQKCSNSSSCQAPAASCCDDNFCREFCKLACLFVSSLDVFFLHYQNGRLLMKHLSMQAALLTL